MVSRWASPEEAVQWMENGGTAIPNGVGAGGRLYVTNLGAAKPGGTGSIRKTRFFRSVRPCTFDTPGDERVKNADFSFN
jgi:hypothetical protein